MIYSSTITSAALRVRESRQVAALLLEGVDAAEWVVRIEEENVFQLRSVHAARRVGRLLRARLRPMGADVWRMVHEGERELATQAVFAGAVRHSRLLGDFLDLAIREQLALFADRLAPSVWLEYLEGCRGRDPAMPDWSDVTARKLRTTVYAMLAEARYLDDTRNLRLQTVFVDPRLVACLRERDEAYVLRCMQVTE